MIIKNAIKSGFKMNIKDLQYYHYLVETKNFSRAAEFFGVSQPTITLSLKRLEEELELKLLVRDQSHKLLKPTEAGLKFDLHAAKILNELTVAQKELARLKDEKISLGLPPIIGNRYFPKLMPAFIENNLMNSLKITEEGSQSLLKMLLNGSLDFALLGSIEPISNHDLLVDVFGRSTLKIIVSKHHRLARKGKISFAELKNEPFIIQDEGFVHGKALKEMAHRARFRPKVIYKTSDVNLLKTMVKENLGIGYLTDLAVSDSDQLAMLELTDINPPEFFLSLVTRTDSALTKKQQKLLEILREQINQNHCQN